MEVEKKYLDILAHTQCSDYCQCQDTEYQTETHETCSGTYADCHSWSAANFICTFLALSLFGTDI